MCGKFTHTIYDYDMIVASVYEILLRKNTRPYTSGLVLVMGATSWVVYIKSYTSVKIESNFILWQGTTHSTQYTPHNHQWLPSFDIFNELQRTSLINILLVHLHKTIT